MPTAPLRLASIAPSSNWNTGTSKTSTTFNVAAGDLLIVTATAEHAGSPSTVTPSASGGAVTWTLLGSQTSGGLNQSLGYIWKGVVGAAATNITVTVPRPSSSNIVWGFTGSRWGSHGGTGAVFVGNNGTGSGAPSVSAACAANSAVMFQVNDWNASAVTGTTYRTINGAAETPAIAPVRVTGTMSIWAAYRTDTGPAGTVTQGLTAPTTLRWIMVGVEILGAPDSGVAFDLGQAASADTAQPVAATKEDALGQPTSPDAAQPLASAKADQLGQGSTADTAHPVAGVKASPVAQASTVETAQPLTLAKSLQLGLATEASQAHPVSSGSAVTLTLGLAIEGSAAQPVAPAKARQLAQATGPDAAQPLTQGKADTLGLATSAEVAHPVSTVTAGSASLQLGLAVEGSTAHGLTRTRGAKALGLATSAETAAQLGRAKARALGLVTGPEQAHPLTAAAALPLGLATSTEQAHPVFTSVPGTQGGYLRSGGGAGQLVAASGSRGATTTSTPPTRAGVLASAAGSRAAALTGDTMSRGGSLQEGP